MKKNIFEEENKIEKVKTICIIILSIILFVFLTIGINNMTHGGKMGFFTLRFFIMSNDSSEAGSSAGDLVVANKIKTEKIKENDVIIYKRNNVLAIKKVIGLEDENGKTNLHIENDNLLKNEKIEDVEIMGKVLFTAKGIGNVAMFIQSPLGMLNIFLLTCCIFIIIKKMLNTNKEVEDEKFVDNEGK